MATEEEQEEFVERSLEALAQIGDDAEREAQLDQLQELAERVEEPGLQDRIYERYLAMGRQLLADDLPTQVDPRVAKGLEPIIGRVGHVRVHTGPLATMAARAMQARAFAIGEDVFFDQAHYAPQTREGGALIAHEVAHAVDPRAGFGMDRIGTEHSTTLERHADTVAEDFVMAQEDTEIAASGEDGDGGGDSGSGDGGGMMSQGVQDEVQIDELDLERRVMEKLKEDEEFWRERLGY